MSDCFSAFFEACPLFGGVQLSPVVIEDFFSIVCFFSNWKVYLSFAEGFFDFGCPSSGSCKFSARNGDISFYGTFC